MCAITVLQTCKGSLMTVSAKAIMRKWPFWSQSGADNSNNQFSQGMLTCREESKIVFLRKACCGHNDQGSWSSLINWKLTRGQTRSFSGQALWGPCYSSREGEQTVGSLAHSLPEAEWACSLYGVRVGLVPRGWWERWLRCFAPPLLRWCVQGVLSTLLLLLTSWFCSSEVAVGLSLSFCSFCPEFAPTFFVFYCFRRGGPRCKH